MASSMKPSDHVIVMFGGNGDLSKRKLIPALWHLFVEGLMPEDFRIVGNSRREFSNEQFDSFARESIEEFGRGDIDEDAWKTFADRLTYVSHEFRPGDTDALRDEILKAEKDIGGDPRRLFYLAVPPAAFGEITLGIGEAALNERATAVFEKPFGTGLEEFRELDRIVHQVFDDGQVFTIDHFLGKETVQNILCLRFANGLFEPVWNRNHIEHVQIDVPETLGIGTRAAFYDKTGSFKDMIVTHLLQVMSFIAMEPPPAFTERFLHDETVKVFESAVPLDPGSVVFGQYAGYRDESGVASGSRTDTFAAAQVLIDNWRWAGVPFFLRTGKRMAENRQSVTLAFREPPRQLFPELRHNLEHDHITLELGPEEGISVTFLAKAPGTKIALAPARMNFTYEGSFGSDLIGPYERLVYDALLCDRTLFTRADGIERVWELVDPVLQEPPEVHSYEAGSWGPRAAEELIAPRRWHLPDEHELITEPASES